MSDDGGVAGVVAEEVNDQLDVADLLGDGQLEEQLDAQAIGAAVGREFGASIGRELGETIGREIHLTVSEGIEREQAPREIAADVKTATVDALLSGLAGLDGRDSLVSLLRSIGDEGGLGDRLADAVPAEPLEDEAADEEAEDEEAVEDEATDEASEEKAETDDETTEDGVEPTDDDGGDGPGEPQVEELEELRQETLEDFLELMSYRDLQSLAKDVGVKANLSKDELVDQIAEELGMEVEA